MIKIGDTIPSTTLYVMGDDGPEARATDDLFSGRVVAVFGVPGAYTPTCSNDHLPGYVANSDALRGKGVDEIVCVAVNDVFVMAAWGAAQGCAGRVTMAADGSGDLTRATGLELDLTGLGLGVRCQRFSMIVDDGVVKDLAVEDDPTKADKSAAEKMLERMAEAYLQKGSAKDGI